MPPINHKPIPLEQRLCRYTVSLNDADYASLLEYGEGRGISHAVRKCAVIIRKSLKKKKPEVTDPNDKGE